METNLTVLSAKADVGFGSTLSTDEELNSTLESEKEMEIDIDDTSCNLSSQEMERVKEECRTNKHVKPPYSYIALITMAVLQVLSISVMYKITLFSFLVDNFFHKIDI